MNVKIFMDTTRGEDVLPWVVFKNHPRANFETTQKPPAAH
jgi:hypothetical protein